MYVNFRMMFAGAGLYRQGVVLIAVFNAANQSIGVYGDEPTDNYHPSGHWTVLASFSSLF